MNGEPLYIAAMKVLEAERLRQAQADGWTGPHMAPLRNALGGLELATEDYRTKHGPVMASEATLRDAFAMKSLPLSFGRKSGVEAFIPDYDAIAQDAYRIADAMMRARR